MENRKQNCFFPVSALAFFCLHASLTLPYAAGMLLSFLGLTVISTRAGSILQWVKGCKPLPVILALANTAGICRAGQEIFYEKCHASGKLVGILSAIPFDAAEGISILCAAAAFWAVFVFVLWFWHKLGAVLSDAFRDVRGREWLLYGLLLLTASAACLLVFSKTQAFYGTEHSYDIIYTSDSPELVKGNVWLHLTHEENDLRQPLFAVFSAPMMGGVWLIGGLLGTAWLQAVLMNLVQLVLLLGGNLLLAKAMGLSAGKRAAFLLLTAAAYPQMLFSLMMEQYISAYFWLMLCIYELCAKGRLEKLSLWGAGGTLLTSLVLLPALSQRSVLREGKRWLKDMVCCGLEFLGVLVLFCRFDVLASLVERIVFLSGFTGADISFWEKLCQYTGFAAACFLAPMAGISHVIPEHISWQLDPVTALNWFGIGLCVLTVLSAWWNREKRSSRIAAVWCVFSVVMLLLLGWGTKENGLILYTLYFGWAFWVLLFQLVETLQRKLGIPWLVPICSVGGTAILAAGNIPRILELIDFAVTYFPV